MIHPQYMAFLILLLMASTETESIWFYVVCLLVSAVLIGIDKRLKIKEVRQ